MNKVRLSNYSDKETDIDCSHNEITTLILEGFYNFYLAMPIILVAAILWSLIIFQKVSSNLLLFSVTWAIASITLMSKWPKWEPKTLNQKIGRASCRERVSSPV